MENSVHPDHSNWIEYVYINVLFLCHLVNATFQNSLTLDVHWILHVAHHYLWLNVTLLLPLQSACFCFLSFHSSYNSPSRSLADEEWLLISLLRWHCHHEVSILAVSFTQMPCRLQSSTWYLGFWILKSGTGDGICPMLFCDLSYWPHSFCRSEYFIFLLVSYFVHMYHLFVETDFISFRVCTQPWDCRIMSGVLILVLWGTCPLSLTVDALTHTCTKRWFAFCLSLSALFFWW